jgi:hypothetical protein
MDLAGAIAADVVVSGDFLAHHDGRHPVRPPRAARAAQATKGTVDRLCQVRERHPLADHRPALPGKRQALCRTRTDDPFLTMEVLYQLS